ncbi:hypothetical protein N9Z05_02745 [Gammaproteobacteria bacterium]|jgi:hypothetical protein|nr:hypothetical protein [Gammaproteobacteria bacterium]MDB2678293.1 hypothetical protein [Gammaproteobacteria bacterium]MDC0941782.1 hypothetical protein [Gammaproteobacteria bacterium]MDC1147569.1 hypothetical protein [Gammaproteobacteria bacterium]
MINEKYIQALILGSVIGFAIVIDDFIGPKPDHKIMQKHIKVKDAKNFNWKEKSGKNMDLHEIENHEVFVFKSDDDDKKIHIKINSKDSSDLDIKSIVSEVTNAIKTFGEENLTDKEIEEIKIELENAKNEVSEVLENIDINIEVEVENN